MGFLDKEIEKYAEAKTTSTSQILNDIQRDTYANMMMPRMLSGHFQGRLLATFSHMIQPQVILEIGTYMGYSALCFAEGLKSDGKIITIDINEELEDKVRKYFADSDYNNVIDFRIGNALEIIPTLNEVFDLVFIDADKENYIEYFDLVIDKVRSGGFIIADNVLWSGKVLTKSNDITTKSISKFNDMVHNDSRVENVLLPVRDGLMILKKN